MGKGGSLLPTEATTAAAPDAEQPRAEIIEPELEEAREETPEEEQARVFAKLKEMSGGEETTDEEEGSKK